MSTPDSSRFDSQFESIEKNFHLIKGVQHPVLNVHEPEPKPIPASREGMLLRLYEFLPEALNMTDEYEAAICIDRILEKITQKAGLELGQPLAVINIASYFVKRSPSETKPNFVNWDTKIRGRFGGLELGNWYDLPQEESRWAAQDYTAQNGLFVTLLPGSFIEYTGGYTQRIQDIRVMLPLNHGNPEVLHDLTPFL